MGYFVNQFKAHLQLKTTWYVLFYGSALLTQVNTAKLSGTISGSFPSKTLRLELKDDKCHDPL